MERDDFKYLGSLISCWFHQDWDESGETTLAEVVALFRAETDTDTQQKTAAEIMAYLHAHPNDAELEQHFYATFEPEIVEGTFGTAREFLEQIVVLISGTPPAV